MTATGTPKRVMPMTVVVVEKNMTWTAKTVITLVATVTKATVTVQKEDQEDMGAVEGRRRMA